MESPSKPDIKLAQRVLPPALFKALVRIFSQNIKDCMLVGGTALSGFYAGHRRSDDIDLFVKSQPAFLQTVLAFKTLEKLKAEIKEAAHSQQYFKAVCRLDNCNFTVDIVLDENLFKQGKFNLCGRRIAVADLLTIFMMKSAALVSRCSEKDLYDLIWLFQNLEGLKIPDIIASGKKIDAGLNPETLLYSVSSSQIRKEACNFSLVPGFDNKKVYSLISKFKKSLVRGLHEYISNNTSSELKAVIDRIKSFE